MRLPIQLCVLLLNLSAAEAVELHYTWKAGDLHSFHYRESVHVRLSGGAGALLTTDAVYHERVMATDTGGGAEVELELVRLTVEGGDAHGPLPVTLPRAERTQRVHVDRRGHFTVPRMISLHLHRGRICLAVHDDSAKSVADRTRVLLVRDGRSGRMRAPTRSTAKALALSLSSADPSVEALPRRVLDLAALPDGDQAAGRSFDVRGAAGAIHGTLARYDGTVATIQWTGGPHPEPGQPELDLRSRFDAAAGRLLELRGTMIRRAPVKTNAAVLLERWAGDGVAPVAGGQ